MAGAGGRGRGRGRGRGLAYPRGGDERAGVVWAHTLGQFAGRGK